MKWWKRIFSVDSLLKEEQKEGPIPASGEVYRRNFAIAWPATIEGALISLMSAIDTIMVGTLGTASIAAVGLTTQPRMILISVISSLCVGITAVTARRKGEDNQEGANRCLRQALMLTLLLAVVLSMLGGVFARPIMLFAGANEDTLADAAMYFQIICLGLVFSCITMAICSALRGIGSTRVTMVTNITANAVNVVLNYLLINGRFGFPALGVRGAAIATVTGNAVGCVIAVIAIAKKGGYLRIDFFSPWRFDKATFSSLYQVTVSSLAEQVCLRVGFFLNSKLIAGLGTVAFASYQIVSQVTSLSFTLGDGLAIAGSSLVGQSLGAKRQDMALLHTKTLQRMAFVVSTVMVFTIISLRYPIASLFSQDPEVLSGAALCFVVVACSFHFQNARTVLSGCLRGAGDVRYVAKTSLIGVLILRPILTWIFCYPMGMALIGSWLSFLLDQGTRCYLTARRVSHGQWLTIKL